MTSNLKLDNASVKPVEKKERIILRLHLNNGKTGYWHDTLKVVYNKDEATAFEKVEQVRDVDYPQGVIYSKIIIENIGE